MRGQQVEHSAARAIAARSISAWWNITPTGPPARIAADSAASSPSGVSRTQSSGPRAAAARSGEGVYNVGGGSRVSLTATLELLAEIAGRPLDVRHSERESGDIQDTGADIARARADLSFTPATHLRASLAAEFEWVRRRRGSRMRAFAAL
jgi:hypothetical protein